MTTSAMESKLTINSLFIAARVKTLTAALVPVFVGSSLAYGLYDKFDGLIFFCTILSALFIQIGTNFFNDAIDFDKGADTKERMGPQRVTQSGLLSSRKVKILAIGSFVLASLFAIPLILKGGWIILLIGLLSLLFGYLYTGGPFPLAYVGLGDLFVIIFFGLVAVSGTFFLHTLIFDWLVLAAGLQVGLLATTLIAINNARDIDQDRKANKRTLAVRLGLRFVKIEVALTQIIPLALCYFWWQAGYHLAAFLPMITMLWSMNLIMDVASSKPSTQFNEFLSKAAKIHIIFGISLAIGFLY